MEGGNLSRGGTTEDPSLRIVDFSHFHDSPRRSPLSFHKPETLPVKKKQNPTQSKTTMGATLSNGGEPSPLPIRLSSH